MQQFRDLTAGGTEPSDALQPGLLRPHSFPSCILHNIFCLYENTNHPKVPEDRLAGTELCFLSKAG